MDIVNVGTVGHCDHNVSNEYKALYAEIQTLRAKVASEEVLVEALRHRVAALECLEHDDELIVEALKTLAHKKLTLQADNLRLREALERIVKADDNVYNCEDDYQGDVIGKLSDIHFKAYNKARKVLSSTPTQSLASHDNEVIERCKNIVANDALAITFQSMGAYRSAIIKQIGELKAEHD